MEGVGEDLLELGELTEEEQAAILEVMLRDSELRRLDEGRVRVLEENETDPMRLRSLSGAWFNEERSKRHCEQTYTCDLVRASIRRRKSKFKDVPLSGVFIGQTEEAPTPDTQLDGLEQEVDKERIQDPPHVPVAVSSLSESANGAYSSSESTIKTNGHKAEEEDSEDDEEDTDSVSSGVTEPDPTPLKPCGSNGSLQKGYTMSGSMMSLFSTGEFGLVEVSGRVQFSLAYNKQREELHIRVCCCEDLAAARKKSSDPYVKVYLLPDKSSHSKKKTSVKKKTLNPVYNQTLKYKVKMGELQGRTLNLSVWHAETLKRNVFLGEVEVTMAMWDWSTTQPLWYDLQPRVQMSPDSINSRGTMLLSVKFCPAGSEGGGLPQTGEVHIWLREAQGLLSIRGGPVDSFIRSYILPDVSHSSGQKTRLVRGSFSPTFNHTMVYDGFKSSDLMEACAELTVWQREGLKTHLLGGARLSPGTGRSYGDPVTWMDSTEEEIGVWTTMMQNPNHWIDTKLSIRTNLSYRPQ